GADGSRLEIKGIYALDAATGAGAANGATGKLKQVGIGRQTAEIENTARVIEGPEHRESVEELERAGGGVEDAEKRRPTASQSLAAARGKGNDAIVVEERPARFRPVARNAHRIGAATERSAAE